MGKLGRGLADLKNRTVGRQPLRYQFEIYPRSVEGLPPGLDNVSFVWERGAKISYTDAEPVDYELNRAAFKQFLKQSATIYKDGNKLVSKEYSFKLQSVQSGLRGGEKRTTVAKAKVDMAQYCGCCRTMESVDIAVQLQPAGLLRATVHSTWLHHYTSDASPDASSQLSGMTGGYSEADNFSISGGNSPKGRNLRTTLSFGQHDSSPPQGASGADGGGAEGAQPSLSSLPSFGSNPFVKSQTAGSGTGTATPPRSRFSGTAGALGGSFSERLAAAGGSVTDKGGARPGGGGDQRSAGAGPLLIRALSAKHRRRSETREEDVIEESEREGALASSEFNSLPAAATADVAEDLPVSTASGTPEYGTPRASIDPASDASMLRELESLRQESLAILGRDSDDEDEGPGDSGRGRRGGGILRWMWPFQGKQGTDTAGPSSSELRLREIMAETNTKKLQAAARQLLEERDAATARAVAADSRLQAASYEAETAQRAKRHLVERLRVTEEQLMQLRDTTLIASLVDAKLQLAQSDLQATDARGQLAKERSRSRSLAAKLTALQSSYDALLHSANSKHQRTHSDGITTPTKALEPASPRLQSLPSL